jgi:hypothetical protein
VLLAPHRNLTRFMIGNRFEEAVEISNKHSRHFGAIKAVAWISHKDRTAI